MVFDYRRTATYYRDWSPQKLWSVNGPGGICWKITCCIKILFPHGTSEMYVTMEVNWGVCVCVGVWLVVNRSDALFKVLLSHGTMLASTETSAILNSSF